MSRENVGREYVRLALALDQHLPGYIDAYFGPPDWQEQAKTEGPRPLPELAQQASMLAVEIANTDTLDNQRQEFLARHVLAMQTSLRLLQGERMALVDERALPLAHGQRSSQTKLGSRGTPRKSSPERASIT